MTAAAPDALPANVEIVGDAPADVAGVPFAENDSGPTPSHFGAGFAREVAQGALFNFEDEAEAGLRSLWPGNPNYDALVKQIRAEQAAYEKAWPKTALAANVAGGVGSALLTGGVAGELGAGAKLAALTAKYASPVARGAEALNTMGGLKGVLARGAAAGVPLGALAGAGAAQGDLGSRGSGALAGAAQGAVVGPAASVVGQGTVGAINWLRTAFSDGAAQKAALAKVADIMRRDGVPFEQAVGNLQQAHAAGIPLTLADAAGRNTVGTAEYLAQRPGTAQSTIVENRLANQADAKSRVPGQVRQALGANPDPTSYEQGLAAMRSSHAAANYDAVRNDATPILDPHIEQLLDNPLIGELFDNAKKLHATERTLSTTLGKPSPPLADIYAPKNPGDLTAAVPQGYAGPAPEWVKTGVAPDVRTLDYLQRAMNDKATNLFNTGQGTLGSLVAQSRQQLVGRLKDLSPTFQKAFDTYRNDSEMINAQKFGAAGGFTDMSPGAAADYVQTLSDSGRNALRNGVAEHLLQRAESTARNENIGANVLGGPRQSATLATLFDDPADFAQFQKAMQLESQIHKNTQQIGQGSPTYRRAAAGADFNGPSLGQQTGRALANLYYLSKGHIVAPLLHMMNTDMWNNGLADQTAKILTTSDPKAASDLLAQHLASHGMATRDAILRGYLGGTLANTVTKPDLVPQAMQTLPRVMAGQPAPGFARGGRFSIDDLVRKYGLPDEPPRSSPFGPVNPQRGVRIRLKTRAFRAAGP